MRGNSPFNREHVGADGHHEAADADRTVKDLLQDAAEHLFRHPYTKIESVQSDLGIARQTVGKYANQLSEKGLLSKHRSERSNYYINAPLVRLFLRSVGWCMLQDCRSTF
ncbi:Fic family protein [Granulibacter bethesdensis CGDNIH1]|uniref:Fic family protein n=1 Tax=Granulibacter bethesdensis (strain ATCC BAA-1260 / CGDNIH1) TaxID=391165 RepID=A0A286M319_GRABC|nr:Fic family protein [Granulibacter bethesdensis]APH64797.1 Fic family protein [Granulibacter bethesdensis]ASV62418.1 Fic family protein [Granulibacter bethesdensis CGDNIH1]